MQLTQAKSNDRTGLNVVSKIRHEVCVTTERRVRDITLV